MTRATFTRWRQAAALLADGVLAIVKVEVEGTLSADLTQIDATRIDFEP